MVPLANVRAKPLAWASWSIPVPIAAMAVALPRTVVPNGLTPLAEASALAATVTLPELSSDALAVAEPSLAKASAL